MRSAHKKFGDVAAVWSVLERLGVAEAIDGVAPRRSDAAVSVGTYIALATLNRIVAPCSKAAFASWWDSTAAPRWCPLPAGSLDHRKFWSAMDRLDRDDLARIEGALSARMVTEFGLDLTALVLDMTISPPTSTPATRPPDRAAGKAKQKRGRPAPVGLALVITSDGGIPLLSHPLPRRSPRRDPSSPG
ncbi:hypothetical protein FXW78_49140 [Rhodococcus opacus]|nr:hypothetical protein [Rhodococcus opacus]